MELAPERADLRDELDMLAQQALYDDATTEFRKAIELQPDLDSPHLHLGAILFQQNLQEALIHLQTANLAPDSAQTYFYLGRPRTKQ